MNQIHPEIKKIRERRDALELTQDQLALRSGLSKGALAQLEVGLRKNPSYDTIKKLTDALDAIEAERKRKKKVA